MSSVILSKRARELQQSEADPTQLPALSTVHESLSPTSPSSSSNVIGRPRAGTLPSTFHLGTTPASATTGSRHLGSGFLNASTASLPASGTNSPNHNNGLDYSFSNSSNTSNTSSSSTANYLLPPNTSSNNSSTSNNSTSRLRSGSLGLPSSGLANAFGPTVWSGGWGSNNPTGSGTSIGDNTRSPESSTYGDDSHVRTLDYLGLESDSPSTTNVNNNSSGFGIFGDVNGETERKLSNSIVHNSSSFGNLRNVSELNQQGRVRSNTVAVFSRTTDSPFNRSPFPSSQIRSSNENMDPEYFPETNTTSSSSYHRSNESTDSSRLLYSSALTLVTGIDELDSQNLPPNRARAATTIGILDESRDVYLRRRAGTTTGGVTSGNNNSGVIGNHQHHQSVEEYSGGTASVLSRRLRGMSIGQDDSPSSTWNNSNSNSSLSRPITPDQPSHSPSPQLPTRSLWIGNLDPATTTAELHAVFSPYGPIENLRLIPDKECGFVNFFSTSDAMHAKEDVLTRLGGQMSGANSSVRIGYGKPEGPSSPSLSLTPNGSLVRNPSSLNNSLNNNNNINNMNGNFSPELMLQCSPTRALWIGSIPSTTTPAQLVMLFSPFGQIESARVLTHKSCGFINFERTEDAIVARNTLSGREILGAELGTVRIGYAKVPNKVVNLATFNSDPNLPITPLTVYNPNSRAYEAVNSPLVGSGLDGNNSYRQSPQPGFNLPIIPIVGMETSSNENGILNFGQQILPENLEPLATTLVGTEIEIKAAMVELGGEEFSAEESTGLAPRTDLTYYDTFPPNAYNDPVLARRYANADAPRLRDIRKQLDGLLTTEEIDQIAFELADECVPLASDYIGNTLIQKLFERASPQGRMALLVKIAPHMAQIGIHKNGTWAVQKIIQTVQTQEEHDLVQKSLQPFTPALLLNDFGNYVVQGALRFGSPITDFIFDAMVDRCWEIGSGRFGARSTRQTLESPLASRYQIKRVAVAILFNSVPLATSSNGALLITWLLDTSNLPGRYRALTNRYIPHLAKLCTHKLASLAILKIINQRIDPQASKLVLDQLNATDSTLIDDILADQVHGTTFLTKILNSAFVDLKERATITERIRLAVGVLRAQTIPAYRTLVESVGMPYQGVTIVPTPLPNNSNFIPSNHQNQNQYNNQNSSPQWQQQQDQRQYTNYSPLPLQQQQNQFPMGYAPYSGQFSQPPNNYPSFFPGQPYFGNNVGPPQNNFQQQPQRLQGGAPPFQQQNFNQQQSNNMNMNNNNISGFNNNQQQGFNNNNNNNTNINNQYPNSSPLPSLQQQPQDGDRLQDFPSLPTSVNGTIQS